MLVLSRKIGEEVVIDGHIRVTVCRIDGHQVRLGFHAPPEVHIKRAELKPLAETPVPRRRKAASNENETAPAATTSSAPAAAEATATQSRVARPARAGWLKRRAR